MDLPYPGQLFSLDIILNRDCTYILVHSQEIVDLANLFSAAIRSTRKRFKSSLNQLILKF